MLRDLSPFSFIVKIWFEDVAPEDAETTWRGHVTHVEGGERRYVDDLEEIPRFIAPYLQARGVQFGLRSRIRRLLRRLRRWPGETPEQTESRR